MKYLLQYTLPLMLLFTLAAGCSSNQNSTVKNMETIEYKEISHLEKTSLGNNSAIINSVTALTGGEIPHKIEISSDTLQIAYDLEKFNEENEESASYWYDSNNQERNSSFNSAILFTLVENANLLEVTFKGESTETHSFTRDELASTLNTSFETWDEEAFEEYKTAFSE
ncbi:DUF4825 domain-containing protein [Rossellomorea oryzaecorticis]|uniref:DUF4825 domain-containing protein n=1 Tax=Rossellomorea oryzaecorticis TaxID=1396505 RepID=A0ABU9K3Z1_9BACI